ncbi:MAG: CRTAC1 family protein [Thermoanaerobaculia bacterium]
MSGELYFAEMMGAGVGLLDYDGDGDLDVYLVQGHMLGEGKRIEDAIFPPRHPLPLTDRLYRNDTHFGENGDIVLRFVDVTEASGIRAEGYGMGVATGDIDNDGWVDLYVTNFGSNQMWRNNGDGTFTDVTERSGTGDPRWGVSASFLDYDRDGWLDLFVGNYVDFRLANHKECAAASGARDYCGPRSYRPEPDRLYHNRGDGTFDDVSERSGIAAARGNALGVVAADFDGDSRLDIYVANDQMPNFLWRNEGDGTFTDDAVLDGVAVNEQGQPEASMGVVAADLDGDRIDDLFMTHLTREKNTFYHNDGGGLFVDTSRASGLGVPSIPFTGFGVGLLDYDRDGWLDLFVANGAVLRIEELLARDDPQPLHQKNQLFRNVTVRPGQGRFSEVTAEAGDVFDLSEVSRGVATGEVDLDGRPDLVVTNNAGPVRLLLNRAGGNHHWLGIALLPAGPPQSLLPVQVEIHRSDGAVLLRRATTDGSYASANDPRIFAGLAQADVTKLRVIWPDGATTECFEPPTDRLLVLYR